MEHVDLAAIVELLLIELHRLNYPKNTITRYRCNINRFLRFMENNSYTTVTPEICDRFLASLAMLTSRQRPRSRRDMRAFRRCAYLLLEYQQYGNIPRRCKFIVKTKSLQNEAMVGILEAFTINLQQLGRSEVTMKAYYGHAFSFLSHAETIHGCITPGQITPQVVGTYCQLLQMRTKKSIKDICVLRVFLKFLKEARSTDHDLSLAVPTYRIARRNRIPTVLSYDQMTALLGAIDRETAMGKRDYAVFLLAARLGLRTTDIMNLRLDNLLWREKLIRFNQSKTGKQVTLPLPLDVGNALIDYITQARPDYGNPYVFLVQFAPYEKITYASTFFWLYKKYAVKAGIIRKEGEHFGLHVLRHTMASHMLARNTALPVISELLGHSSTDSTKAYLKTDVEALRICALPMPEVVKHD
ncbi:MAG: site-specific integrase [bacterium]|nr:site-specific integrase [bacterium]